MNDSVVEEVSAHFTSLWRSWCFQSFLSYHQKIEKCLFSSTAVFVQGSISADKAKTARAVDLLSYWTASELHFPILTSAVLHSLISHLIKASLPLSLTVISYWWSPIVWCYYLFLFPCGITIDVLELFLTAWLLPWMIAVSRVRFCCSYHHLSHETYEGTFTAKDSGSQPLNLWICLNSHLMAVEPPWIWSAPMQSWLRHKKWIACYPGRNWLSDFHGFAKLTARTKLWNVFLVASGGSRIIIIAYRLRFRKDSQSAPRPRFEKNLNHLRDLELTRSLAEKEKKHYLQLSYQVSVGNASGRSSSPWWPPFRDMPGCWPMIWYCRPPSWLR